MDTDQLTQQYLDRHRDQCARVRLDRRQILWLLLLLVLAFDVGLFRWDVLLYAVNFIFAALYLGVISFRLLAVGLALRRPREIPSAPPKAADLPV